MSASVRQVNCGSVYQGKPIIGIVGGIGSGKSTVAGIFGEMGCKVISSDDQVREAYRDPAVLGQLREWWGDRVFMQDGRVNRRAVGDIVFADPGQRERLEKLLHPRVAAARDGMMAEAAGEAQVLAYVWDTPLLLETGLHRQCDAVVFVESPFEMRLSRLRQSRGWEEGELSRRENLQIPLDKKREISQYRVDNTADPDDVRSQVRDVISRILAARSLK